MKPWHKVAVKLLEAGNGVRLAGTKLLVTSPRAMVALETTHLREHHAAQIVAAVHGALKNLEKEHTDGDPTRGAGDKARAGSDEPPSGVGP